MKRKTLETLGLTDEQIESVMSAHGQATSDLTKEINDKDKTIRTLKSEKSDLEKQVSEGESHKKKVERLERLNEDYESQIKAYKEQVASNELDKAIIKAVPDAYNTDDIFKLIDREQFEYDDEGNVKNFDDVIGGFRESRPHLFKSDNNDPGNQAGNESNSNNTTSSNQNSSSNYQSSSSQGNKKGQGDEDFEKIGADLAAQFNQK